MRQQFAVLVADIAFRGGDGASPVQEARLAGDLAHTGKQRAHTVDLELNRCVTLAGSGVPSKTTRPSSASVIVKFSASAIGASG
jgi:hypothetical protein